MAAPHEPMSRRKAFLTLGGIGLGLAAMMWWAEFGRTESEPKTAEGRITSCQTMRRGTTVMVELHLDAPPFAVRYQVDPDRREALDRACGDGERVRLVYRTTQGRFVGDVDWVYAIALAEPLRWILSPEDADAAASSHRHTMLAIVAAFVAGGFAAIVAGARAKPAPAG